MCSAIGVLCTYDGEKLETIGERRIVIIELVFRFSSRCSRKTALRNKISIDVCEVVLFHDLFLAGKELRCSMQQIRLHPEYVRLARRPVFLVALDSNLTNDHDALM